MMGAGALNPQDMAEAMVGNDDPVANASINSDPPEGEDSEPNLDRTYIAIDGVDRDEFSTEEAEHIERMVLEYTLGDLGYDVCDVRLISGDSGVVEFDVEPDWYDPEEDATVD